MVALKLGCTSESSGNHVKVDCCEKHPHTLTRSQVSPRICPGDAHSYAAHLGIMIENLHIYKGFQLDFFLTSE